MDKLENGLYHVNHKTNGWGVAKKSTHQWFYGGSATSEKDFLEIDPNPIIRHSEANGKILQLQEFLKSQKSINIWNKAQIETLREDNKHLNTIYLDVVTKYLKIIQLFYEEDTLLQSALSLLKTTETDSSVVKDIETFYLKLKQLTED